MSAAAVAPSQPDEPNREVAEHTAPATLPPFGSLAPIYAVSTAVLLGDALGNFGLYLPLWVAVASAVIAALLFLGRKHAGASLLALLAIASAATVPVNQRLRAAHDAGKIGRLPDGSRVTIIGTIFREPELTGAESTRLLIKVSSAALESQRPIALSGVVRVTVLGPADFKVGEQVRATANLRFPRNFGNPGEFDYESYLRRQGIDATLTVASSRGRSRIEIVGYQPRFPATEIERIRGRIRTFFEQNLSYPESAEMRALIIGDRGGIRAELRDRFALTGMAHLLVISGLHLGFVAGAAFALIRFLAGFFPVLLECGWANRIAALAAVVAVSAYAAIAGHHPSTLRALVMVDTYMLAILIGRSREVLASIFLAALVICLISPGSTADTSFQLSFAAVAAIVFGMRRFEAWWRSWILPPAPGNRAPLSARVAKVVAGYVAVSFWALVGTAPLTAYHFNQFSLVGLVANAVVVPIMGFGAVICGLVAAALSFVWQPPARTVLMVAARLLGVSNWLAGWFEGWPLAWIRIFTPTSAELAIFYLALLICFLRSGAAIRGVTMHPSGLPRAERRRAWTYTAAAVLAIALLTLTDAGWWTYRRYFDPDLRVTFLSVGQGDAAVVRFPGSRVMLVDAGPAYGSFDSGEWVVARYLWSRKIMRVDDLVLSHPDLDHFGGFGFIVRNFAPRRFWQGPAVSSDASFKKLIAALHAADVTINQADESYPALKIGRGRVEFLGPPHGAKLSHNNSSMVLRMELGATSVLFTGDLERGGERVLLERRSGLNATVLKVPHHGSKTSSLPAFVQAMHPAVAVISLGYHNRFGFPSPAVLETYRNAGALVVRTDSAGAVSLDSDGHQVRLWSWRDGPIPLPKVLGLSPSGAY